MSRLSRMHNRKDNTGSTVMEDVNMSLQQMEEAIQVIPNADKAAYLEAMERCPWLVACEPGPMRFIRYHKFNIWEAARRFVKFWEVRKEVFGNDRAFLPMHQTGNGALSDYDLELFSTGFFSLLPDDSGDSNYQIVPCLIPSRIVRDNEDLKTFMKCSFYFHSVVMENTNDDKPCYTCILACNWKGFKRLQGIEPAATMLSHFPMYGESPFFVQIPDDGVEKMTYFQMIVPLILKIVNMINRAADRTQVIGGSSFQDIANQLVDHGFHRESLPPECGGSWTMDKFRQWQKERIELERLRERHYMSLAAARMKNHRYIAAAMPEPFDESGTSKTGQSRAAFQSTAASAGSMSLATAHKKNPPAAMKAVQGTPTTTTNATTTTVDKRRILDRIHSKNKRIRRKQKFEVLQASLEEAKAQNKLLKSENIRLEKLVKRAHEVVLSSGAVQQDHHHQQQQQEPVHPSMAAAHLPQQHQTTHPLHPSIPAAVPLTQLHQTTTYQPALNPATGALFQQQYQLNPTLAQQQQLQLLHPQWLDGALMNSSAMNFLQMHQLTLPNHHAAAEALQPRFDGHGTSTVWSRSVFTTTTTNASTLQTHTPTNDLFTERPRRREEEEQQQQHQYEERKPPPTW